MNKCPWVSLINDARDFHKPVALVGIAKTVPKDDRQRSWDFGFLCRKGVLSWEGKDWGNCPEEERDGDEVHCRSGLGDGGFGDPPRAARAVLRAWCGSADQPRRASAPDDIRSCDTH